MTALELEWSRAFNRHVKRRGSKKTRLEHRIVHPSIEMPSADSVPITDFLVGGCRMVSGILLTAQSCHSAHGHLPA